MEKIEVLKRSELCRDLTDKELAVIEKICEPKVFEAGAILCKQGEADRKIYIVEHGLLGIILEIGMAQRQVQGAADYETAGWSAVIEPYVYTATVKAIEKTSVLSIDGRELTKMRETNPGLSAKICWTVARTLAERLRLAYTQLVGVTGRYSHG